jgi:hypothetical protein
MRRRHTSGHKRGGSYRALTNETKYPFIVELAVTGEELELALSRRIIDFHNRRHIRTRHGRTILRNDETLKSTNDNEKFARRSLKTPRGAFYCYRGFPAPQSFEEQRACFMIAIWGAIYETKARCRHFRSCNTGACSRAAANRT